MVRNLLVKSGRFSVVANDNKTHKSKIDKMIVIDVYMKIFVPDMVTLVASIILRLLFEQSQKLK